MRSLIVLACAFAVCNGQLLAPIGIGAHASQYHAQDELGQYSYGYAGGPSSKSEVRTADGVVRGAYSHIDGHGLVQTTNYVSDPVNGFRVAATNLPVGPAPIAPIAAAPIAVAPAPVAAVRTIAHAPLIAAAPAFIGTPTYTAAAAPFHNGAVHHAPLPVPPAHTPEVARATAEHLNAKLIAQLRA